MSSQQPTMEYGADEISALVLDPGYSVTRAGFAGEDTPKSVVPTYYAKRVGSSLPIFDDNALFDAQSGLDIGNPLSANGIVEDWDVAAKLWEYTITSRLTGRKQTSALRNGLNDAPKGEDIDMNDVDAVEDQETPLAESPLLVTEPGWNPVKNREKTIELAMEDWGAPAFYLGRSGVLAAFASGKASSLVVDIGAANTAVTGVHDGLMLKKSSAHSGIAGNFISDQVRQMFVQMQPPVPITPHYFVTSKTPVDAGAPAQAVYRSFATQPTALYRALQEERVLGEFKESVLQVWDPQRSGGTTLANSLESLRASEPGRPFEMPDGWNQVFGTERYKPTEGLWDEKAAISDPGYKGPSVTAQTTIPGLIKTALATVDADLKPTLLANVVLSGGTSLIPGTPQRLDYELRTSYPSLRVRLQAPGNVTERKYASWIGGSILASLGTFHQMWVSKREYEEHGPSIVEKRCK